MHEESEQQVNIFLWCFMRNQFIKMQYPPIQDIREDSEEKDQEVIVELHVADVIFTVNDNYRALLRRRQ